MKIFLLALMVASFAESIQLMHSGKRRRAAHSSNDRRNKGLKWGKGHLKKRGSFLKKRGSHSDDSHSGSDHHSSNHKNNHGLKRNKHGRGGRKHQSTSCSQEHRHVVPIKRNKHIPKKWHGRRFSIVGETQRRLVFLKPHAKIVKKIKKPKPEHKEHQEGDHSDHGKKKGHNSHSDHGKKEGHHSHSDHKDHKGDHSDQGKHKGQIVRPIPQGKPEDCDNSQKAVIKKPKKKLVIGSRNLKAIFNKLQTGAHPDNDDNHNHNGHHDNRDHHGIKRRHVKKPKHIRVPKKSS